MSEQVRLEWNSAVDLERSAAQRLREDAHALRSAADRIEAALPSIGEPDSEGAMLAAVELRTAAMQGELAATDAIHACGVLSATAVIRQHVVPLPGEKAA